MEQKLANPAPLGLLGFAMTTILLNIHNMGFFPISAVIISMGIFYGGIAQVIAGIMEFKKGNTFGTAAFVSYGFFWLTLVAIWLLPETGFAKAGATEASFMGWYLFIWGVFSACMWYGTWGGSKVQQFVFLTVTLLFFLLAIHNWMAGCGEAGHYVGIIAGIVGVICGSSAFYLGVAEILSEVKGKKVLPF